MKPPVRIRVWIAGSLAVCAALLIGLTWLTGRANQPENRRAQVRPAAHEPMTIAQHVDAVAGAFKISRSAMRTRIVREGAAAVPELRIQVAPDFSSLEFNSALAVALDDADAKVVGTEHTREKAISLRIVQGGAPVMIVVLDLRQPPQQQRKESRH
jgi:hypothetical protein